MATRKTTTAKKSTTATKTKTKKAAAKTATAKKAAPRRAATPKAPVAVLKTAAPIAGVSMPKVAAPAPAPAQVAAAAPQVVPPAVTVVSGPTVRKNELIERIVQESGMKKKDVKPVVEATLAVLGRSLANGEELVAHPLGKLKVNRERMLPNGKMIIVKVRQNAATLNVNDPLAEPAD